MNKSVDYGKWNCNNHYFPLRYFCKNDQQLLCSKCLPKHQYHQVEGFNPKTFMTPEKISIPNISKKPYYPIKIPDYNKPKAINYNKYVTINSNDLQEIQNSYRGLKGNIVNKINDELNAIQKVINTYPERAAMKSIVNPPSKNTPIYKSELSTLPSIANSKIPNIKAPIYSPPSSIQTIPNSPPIQTSKIQEPLAPISSIQYYMKEKETKIYMKWDDDLNSIYLFDTQTFDGKKISLENFDIPSDSSLLVDKGKIFISGGNMGANNQSSACYFIDLTDLSLTNLANMYIERRSHSLAKIRGTYIYSAGGFNSTKGYLNSVEKYFIRDDKWETAPPLSFGRQDSALCSFNTVNLYCFGGSIFNNNVWNYFSTIERLNTDAAIGWETIDLVINEGWTNRAYVGAKQISESEILLFGGYDSDHYNDSFIFRPNEKQIIDTNVKLRNTSSFFQRNTNIIIDDNFIFAIGYPQFDVHRFSISRRVWEFLKEDLWFDR